MCVWPTLGYPEPACIYQATDEEKKDATEALAKYDALTDDESRKRSLQSLHVCI